MINLIQIDFATHDLTPYDAIVNAANMTLRPGGGICGAIHDRAGPQVAYECGRISFCPTTCNATTSGGRLDLDIIHAVGPVASGDPARDYQMLLHTYDNIVDTCQHSVWGRILCPVISSGIYGISVEVSTKAASHVFSKLPDLYVDLFSKKESE